MEKIINSAYVILIIILITNLKCKKDNKSDISTPPTVFINTAPKAYAGPDIWVMIPDHSCTITGAVADDEYNIDKHSWKKISGPLSGSIKNPDALVVSVSGLVKGTYEFELQVTDKSGLIDKDTVTVFVREPAPPGQGEVILKDFIWNCPMGCSLIIQCFSCLVPNGQSFKLYLRRDNSNQWIEVKAVERAVDSDKYTYSLDKNILYVYAYLDDEWNETPDILLTY